MYAHPMTVRIFKPVVIKSGFRRHVLLGEPRFFHELQLKPRRGRDIDSETAGFGFRRSALQNALAGAAVKGWLDERIFLLEGINERDNLFIIERAVKNYFPLSFGAIF